MNKKILTVLFISLTLIMCSAVAAENLTTTEQGEVNGGVYSHAVQKTPYGSQEPGGNLEEVSFNITNKQESNINYQSNSGENQQTTTPSIKDVDNARLYTMVYVQGTNNRYGAIINVTLDGDNDGSYETVLENNRVLQIQSSTDGTVYTVNENITRVYSDYLLSYDIAKYIKADTINVHVQTYSGTDMGFADAKIKCIGLLAAYNVDSSDEKYDYWFNTGHAWTNEGTSTTFNTINYPRPEQAFLTQVSTSSSASNVFVNGIALDTKTPSGYFSENVWDISSLYDDSSNTVLENLPGEGLYGSSFKTISATLVLANTEASSESNVKVDKFKVSSNSGDALVYVPNTIQVTVSNDGSQVDNAKLTLKIGDYSETVDVTNLNSTAQNFNFNYVTDERNTYDVSIEMDYLNGVTEAIYNGTLDVKYNGYMGKSFTGGENFTTKRVYEGLNSITIIPVHDYKSANWENFSATVNTADYGLVDTDKYVEMLYYQPYNWDYDYVLNTYQLLINGNELSPIAQYNDTKGFGTQWDFPSGLLVYNITKNLIANGSNTFNITRIGPANLALYTGYIVAVYKNATQPSIIKITEETDLLNTEASGYGTNSSTAISYAIYDDINITNLNSSKLCVVTGAANWPDSNIIVNDVRYGSMSDNWNQTQQMSFSNYNVTNLADGENIITLQSVEDNLVIFSTILTITYNETLVNVTNVTVTSNSNNFLVHENNNIRVTLKSEKEHTPIEVTLKIDDDEITQSVEEVGITTTLDFNYIPTTNGTKNVEVTIKYLNNSVETAYTGTLEAYYNGYMGKSFTNGQNITTKHNYTGKNTVVIIPIEFYLSNKYNETQFTFNSADYGIVEQNKVVDVLYYQGYNWLKTNENIFIVLNDEPLWDPIAQYNDTKGFGSYNYPSGLVVFNAKGQFKANSTNVMYILKDGNDRALYGGYFVVIYANNTEETDIIINEGADLLNPESNGFGANTSNTIAYANYENINADDAILYTISAAADKAGESKIIVNNKEYGSLADKYDSTSRISIVESNVDNLVNGTNLVSLQSINDNLFAMSTILMITHPAIPNVVVDNVDVTASKGDLLVETDNTISIKLTNDGSEATATLNVTIDGQSTTKTLENFTGETTINITYNPTTTGAKDIKVDIIYDDTTQTLYEGTINAYYNGYRGKSFTNGENFTTQRQYEGKNTLILEQFNYYNWKEDSIATYDATQLDNDKIVDVLYYQGYNWDKYLNFTLKVNDEESPIIANYSDTKGFGTYNYPSGVVVFNITKQFKAGQINQITPIQLENNNNILYGGILVIIYANNTETTSILINEGSDLLNPEASGLTTNDYTIAYSNYENIKSGDAVLYTISAAADKADGSKIIVNNKEYQSLSDNYDATSKLSIIETNIDNLQEGTNLVSLQSINDNLFAMGTILVVTHPSELTLKVDTTKFTVGTNASITASIYNGDTIVTSINKGKVAFKVNGKTLKDANGKVIYAKVVNGTATIENYEIPESWAKEGVTIEAVYSGSTQCDSLRSEKEDIEITAAEYTITTQDITAKAGQTVTFNATIDGGVSPVNTGKVVFKINGKTVKDENGKTIYAEVTNGQASLKFTIPDSYKTKDYTITATYISNSYKRITDTKTLTITS